MKIELKKITVRELTNGYKDNNENGVVGYGGKLDIRPPYQREFVYKDKQRDAVIHTVTRNFPLNVMYWAVREDGNFEMIDGQQRTISICQYINNDFSVEGLSSHKQGFDNLTKDQKEQILNYELDIYLCSGTDSEKLEWFKIINITGEKLTEQELRNAVYSGSWVSDAKRYFSKNGCVAYSIGSNYLNGTPIRQEYLETAIKWISNGKIEDYMLEHQQDENAGALWRYFQAVITWVSTTFTKNRKFMKGVEWGELYNAYKDEKYDTKKIEEEIKRLILDDDVTKKKGIYPYILTHNEKYLSIREFSDGIKQKVYTKQKGICIKCEKKFAITEMQADHIKPWSKGGKTIQENCQMLCAGCNRTKSNK